MRIGNEVIHQTREGARILICYVRCAALHDDLFLRDVTVESMMRSNHLALQIVIVSLGDAYLNKITDRKFFG